MYAIIEVGGKQLCVNKGDIVLVEKLEGEDGKSITLDKVLLVADGEKIDIGRPYLKEAKVTAKILKQTKGPKLLSFKYRRRKSSHWKKGHRQQLTSIQIDQIKS
jgi:large subunit ribosomal protein L21